MRNLQTRRLRSVLAAVAVAVVGLAWLASPATAEDEDRRVVHKIRIGCDDSDCVETKELEELLEETGVFAWSSSDGPHRFRFRAHAGGGFLGIQMAELTSELRAHFGVAEDAGVMISRVVEDSPAARAGLEVGDILTAVDGESIGSGMQLSHSIRSREDGAAVLLEVWRNGSMLNLTATVEERSGTPAGFQHAFVLECDDEEEDCTFARHRSGGLHGKFGSVCEGAGPCEVSVKCDNDGDNCVCTVNGEERDCADLPGFDD